MTEADEKIKLLGAQVNFDECLDIFFLDSLTRVNFSYSF